MPSTALAASAKLFRNRNFLLVLALVLGLAIGKPGASLVQPIVLPLLGLVMALSTLNISSHQFSSAKKVSTVILQSLLLNYVILGGITLLLARWFITDYDIWIGFAVLALTPPAPAVVPFTYALRGDVTFSLIGMIGGYIAALAIMPVGLAYFLGSQVFSPLSLLLVLGELIVVPLILASLLSHLGASRYIEPHRGIIVNWSLAAITFSIIGLNRQAFISDFNVLISTSAIAIATTFVLAYLLEVAARALRIKHEKSVSIMLMGTAKNWSMAGGLLLTLFSERSAIPPSVCVFFAIFMIVWLEYHFRRHK